MANDSQKPKRPRRKLILRPWLQEIIDNLPPGYEINKIIVREVEVTLVSSREGVRGMRVRRLRAPAKRK